MDWMHCLPSGQPALNGSMRVKLRGAFLFGGVKSRVAGIDPQHAGLRIPLIGGLRRVLRFPAPT